MSNAPEYIATGTGAARRRLTEAEAARGALPERMTSEEWKAMAQATGPIRPAQRSLSGSGVLLDAPTPPPAEADGGG